MTKNNGNLRVVPVELIDELLEYLKRQPYVEVQSLIARFRECQIVANPTTTAPERSHPPINTISGIFAAQQRAQAHVDARKNAGPENSEEERPPGKTIVRRPNGSPSTLDL